jgi:hypothetical protein
MPRPYKGLKRFYPCGKILVTERFESIPRDLYVSRMKITCLLLLTCHLILYEISPKSAKPAQNNKYLKIRKISAELKFYLGESMSIVYLEPYVKSVATWLAFHQVHNHDKIR